MTTRHLIYWTESRASFTLRPSRWRTPKDELNGYMLSSFVKDPEKAFREHTEKLETVLEDYRRYDSLLREYEALSTSTDCNKKLQKTFARLAEELRESLYPKDTKKWQSFQSVEQLEQYIKARKDVLI
jgi:hypothetical protein